MKELALAIASLKESLAKPDLSKKVKQVLSKRLIKLQIRKEELSRRNQSKASPIHIKKEVKAKTPKRKTRIKKTEAEYLILTRFIGEKDWFSIRSFFTDQTEAKEHAEELTKNDREQRWEYKAVKADHYSLYKTYRDLKN